MKKKNIFPEKNSKDIGYVCPSASWGDMTAQLPNDKHPFSDYTDIYPYLHEYEGESGYKSNNDAE
ncbi:MAG: hypothetical protein J6Y64_04095 [Ruminococcus sp.]|nr:hypothetical protein [Ruminococcus sp.]